MVSVFDFDDYKLFVNTRIQEMPKKGYGQYQRLAEHLKINSVTISQIFKGNRELGIDQALELSEFLGLSEIERDFFLLLVDHARASTQKWKSFIEKKIRLKKTEARNLKSRLQPEKDIVEEVRSTFYSNWYYSGIRLSTSIKSFSTLESIAHHFQLPRPLVAEVLEFLIRQRLVVEKDGRYAIGPKSTHVESTSPLVNRHHANWRIKGLQKMGHMDSEELFFTGPLSLSKKALEEIRSDLTNFIQDTTMKVKESDSEILACLNIDWFKF
ncbi:MAG: TIGR02147 family protein [Bdellovibrionales bacterium]